MICNGVYGCRAEPRVAVRPGRALRDLRRREARSRGDSVLTYPRAGREDRLVPGGHRGVLHRADVATHRPVRRVGTATRSEPGRAGRTCHGPGPCGGPAAPGRGRVRAHGGQARGAAATTGAPDRLHRPGRCAGRPGRGARGLPPWRHHDRARVGNGGSRQDERRRALVARRGRRIPGRPALPEPAWL